MKMEPLLKAKYKGQDEKISDAKIYDRAIRQEIIGGSALLDIDEKITSMLRKRNISEDCRTFLYSFREGLGKIRWEMLWELKNRYAEPVGRREVQKLISDTSLLQYSPGLSDVVRSFRSSLIDMFQEMVVTEE